LRREWGRKEKIFSFVFSCSAAQAFFSKANRVRTIAERERERERERRGERARIECKKTAAGKFTKKERDRDRDDVLLSILFLSLF
jgi:hypothetical protein